MTKATPIRTEEKQRKNNENCNNLSSIKLFYKINSFPKQLGLVPVFTFPLTYKYPVLWV